MTDNEIIKALECCLSGKDYDTACMKCPIEPICESDDILLKYALDLINRQKAEIERLKKKANTPFAKVTFDENKLKEIVSDVAKNIEFNLNSVKSEAIKEFAERLKEKLDNCRMVHDYIYTGYDTRDIRYCIDNLVKEMTEVNENEMPDMRK